HVLPDLVDEGVRLGLGDAGGQRCVPQVQRRHLGVHGVQVAALGELTQVWRQAGRARSTAQGEGPPLPQLPAAWPHGRTAARWSASRIASATIVSVGFDAPPVGNTELPATYRFATPCTLRLASTTPSCGLSCMRVVPMWWLPPDVESGKSGPGSSRMRTRPA